MLNTCFSVAFEAPSWNDPDFFAMTFFKRIIGDYRCDKFTGIHLNSAHLQYNSFHTWLGNFPDMILHQPFYIPYSDTGLFGNFIYGNEMYTQEMSIKTQNQMSTYAQYINQAEVFRARNKYFNDLLELNCPVEVSFDNALQIAYLNRIISHTETATRISHMTPAYVKKVATKWFWDKETVVTAYGNLHGGIINAHYNRTFKRATLGDYSLIMVNFQY